MTEPRVEPTAKLWLWRNFVNGRPEYWAFDNAFPIRMDGGDPQTLGEPCGYAIFKESRCARPEVTEAGILRRIAPPVLDVRLREALTDERGWLIERKAHPFGMGSKPAAWWIGGFSKLTDDGAWTTDSNVAVRFCRAEDATTALLAVMAREVIRGSARSRFTITEHIWSDGVALALPGGRTCPTSSRPT